MTEHLTAAMQEADGNYNRLVLLVGESGTGKSSVMQDFAKEIGIDVLNISLAISEKLMELPPQKRGFRLQRILHDLMTEQDSPLLIDNTEILFDATLQQDPLRLLLTLSRNSTIVATWNGAADAGSLIYAEPGHPEYRKYDNCDALIVSIAELL